ncbi:MAG: glycosyltransferase family 2 protein [Alphaproteobacteria bacterium]|nr:glycosyltransferase family 2 protein [Alphaproteobacteria bacterium]
MQVTVDEALHMAFQRAQAFDLDAAEHILRQVRAGVPDHVPAASRLLTVLLVRDRLAEAEELAAAYPGGVSAMPALSEVVALFRSQTPPPEPVGTIVIPAFQAATHIEEALDSVEAAVAFFRQASGDARARFLIAVGDDASTDGTGDVVAAWAERREWSDLVVARSARNAGQSTARNRAARLARGPYLWFLDADDVFLPEHIHLGWRALEARPQAAFVRTGIHFEGIDDQVTLVHRISNQNTAPSNLCVRAVCHHFVGGFPEAQAYRNGGGEDAAYSDFLGCLFYGIRKMRQTVLYRRRPGNGLDVQAEMFTGRKPLDAATFDRGVMLRQLVARALTDRTILGLIEAPRPPDLPPVRSFRRPFENIDSDPEFGVRASSPSAPSGSVRAAEGAIDVQRPRG